MRGVKDGAEEVGEGQIMVEFGLNPVGSGSLLRV